MATPINPSESSPRAQSAGKASTLPANEVPLANEVAAPEEVNRVEGQDQFSTRSAPKVAEPFEGPKDGLIAAIKGKLFVLARKELQKEHGVGKSKDVHDPGLLDEIGSSAAFGFGLNERLYPSDAPEIAGDKFAAEYSK
jgi:hypothetical protein